MDEADASPTAVFEQATDETRLAVLHALAEAHGESPTDPWLAYSDLREAAGVRDNGNFNYHLDRLEDLVVGGDPGYRLSRLGMLVVSALASGWFDPDWTWGPVDVPGSCRDCGDPLHLRYADGVLRVTCGDPDHAIPLSVPPSLLADHPEETVAERVAFEENRWGSLTRQGICSECRGRVDGELERRPDAPGYHYRGRCGRCGFVHGVPVGMFLVDHPAVVAFYHDHGVDVRTTPFWTLSWCAPGTATVVAEDPLRLRVDVEHGGERLSLTLDRSGGVVGTERTDAEGDPAGEG